MRTVQVRVESYAGYKADERPLRFQAGHRTYAVIEIEDQWHSPGATTFRVRADDGNVYVLTHRFGQDTWSLESYRRTPPQE